MKFQMEKHFVLEQPAYIQLMRKHNDVDYLFVCGLYALLGGAAVYVVYACFTGRKTTEDQEDKDKTKLTFVEVFIREGNKNYNAMFHEYNILREKLL